MTNTELAQLATLIADRLANQLRLRDGIGLKQITGLSLASIERLKRAQKIPFLKVGRRVLYDPDAVIAALAAQTIESKPKPSEENE
jgi:hypothetical protein